MGPSLPAEKPPENEEDVEEIKGQREVEGTGRLNHIVGTLNPATPEH